MIRVSVSGLRDYTMCKKKAYYRRYRSGDKVETASLIVGRVIHDLIDKYESEGDVNLATCKESLVSELSSTGVEFLRWQTVPKLLELVDTCFINYLSLSKLFPPIIESEEFFKISYSDSAEIVGKFDQRREGNLLLELKTSHREPGWYFLEADLQATLYSWAYRELYDKLPIYYYAHLPSGSVYRLERYCFDELFISIDDYIHDFDTENLPMECDNYKCSRCGYRELCFGEEGISKLAISTKSVKSNPVEITNKFFTP